MNRLKGQKSLYLLQHANNPVHWFPYGDEAFSLAKVEDKIILISVGYSSCHWCHVMEKEVFENEEAAGIMNEGFICIKVDREERPDVDHYLMERVQAMGQRGGWPLNCFLTPDGKFFFGATYYPVHQWIKLLKEILRIFKTERYLLDEQAREIAKRTVEPLKQFSQYRLKSDFIPNDLPKKLLPLFDPVYGGVKGAPKFPMPCLLSLLVSLTSLPRAQSSYDLVTLTLRQMMAGGIYDQLNGGFFRYSVDEKWIIPHFEKMLYDNALLLCVYGEAALFFKMEFEIKAIKGIVSFLEKYMRSPAGGYCSSIDADNDYGEGHYYVFTEAELVAAAGDFYDFFHKYFRIEKDSYLNEDSFILRVPLEGKNHTKNLSGEVSSETTQAVIENLRSIQISRPHPVIDPKIVVSWNAMLLYGYLKAWQALRDENIFLKAKNLANYLMNNAIDKDSSQVFHVIYEGENSVPGFLEDYAWLAFSFLYYYCHSANKEFLELGLYLLKEANCRFGLEEEKLLYSNVPVSPMNERVQEIFDNVTPSPNSVYCRALVLAGKIMGEHWYLERAGEMLSIVGGAIHQHPAYMANWILAALERSGDSLIVKVPSERLLDSYKLLISSGHPLLTIIPQQDQKTEGQYQICTTYACIYASYDIEDILLEINKIKQK